MRHSFLGGFGRTSGSGAIPHCCADLYDHTGKCQQYGKRQGEIGEVDKGHNGLLSKRAGIEFMPQAAIQDCKNAAPERGKDQAKSEGHGSKT